MSLGPLRWVVVAVAVGLGLAFWGFTIDDAFISLRYGYNLVHHGQLAFNVGEPASLGFSNPFWTLVLAPATWLPEAATIAAAKILGLLAAAVLVYWVATPATWARLFGALLVATNVSVVAYSVGGLETTLFALFVYGGARRWVADGDPRGGAALLALAACTRPEGIVAFALVAVLGKRRALAFRVFILPVGLLALFEIAYFGSIVPLAYFAKPADLLNGALYGLRFLLQLTMVALLVPVVVGTVSGGRWAAACALLATAWLGIVFVEGGDWMPAYRLLVPAVPFLAELAAAGVAPIFRPIQRRVGPRAAALALLVAFAPSFVWAGVQIVSLQPQTREGPRSRRNAAVLADALRARLRSVALVDVGYLAYRSRLRVFDLAGVTEPVVAHAPGGHLDKFIDDVYLAQRDPDAFVLHNRGPDLFAPGSFPVELRLSRGHFLRNRYRYEGAFPYSREYVYHLFVRENLGRARAQP